MGSLGVTQGDMDAIDFLGSSLGTEETVAT